MKLKRPNKFRETSETVAEYLTVSLIRTLDDITTALGRLSFADNFKSDQITVTIPAGTVNQAIRHSLGIVPLGRLVIRSTGSGIVDGTTEWTQDYVYLSNTGGSAVTLTIILLG